MASSSSKTHKKVLGARIAMCTQLLTFQVLYKAGRFARGLSITRHITKIKSSLARTGGHLMQALRSGRDQATHRAECECTVRMAT